MGCRSFRPTIQSLFRHTLQTIRDARTSPALRSTFLVFSASAFSSVLGFLGSIFVIRTLSVEDYGSLAVFNNLAALVAGIILAGFNLGFVRFLSYYLARNTSTAKKLLHDVFRWEGILALAILFIAVVGAPTFAEKLFHKSNLTPYIIASGAFMVLTVFSALLQSVFQSLKRFNIITTLIVSQAILLNVSLITLNHLRLLTTQRVIFITIVSSFITIFVGVITYLRTDFHKMRQGRSTDNAFREMLHYGQWLIIISLCALLFSKLDVFMLTAMVDLKHVGLYSFANTIYSNMLIVLAAMNMILFPYISELESTHDIRRASRKILTLSVFAALALIPFLFLIKPVVLLIFGARYLPAMPILNIMLIGYVISVALNPLLNMLLIIQEQKFMAAVNFCVLVYHVAGNLLLIPRFGVMGAVIVTTSGIMWSNLLMFIRLLNLLHHNGPNKTYTPTTTSVDIST